MSESLPELRQNVGLMTSVMVDTGAQIAVEPPRQYVSNVGATTGRVPWIVQFTSSYGHGSASLHIATRELLEELRDAITAALDAAPDES